MRAFLKEFYLKYKGIFLESFLLIFVGSFILFTLAYFLSVYSDNNGYSLINPEDYYCPSWKGWWHQITFYYYMGFICIIVLIIGFLFIVGVPSILGVLGGLIMWIITGIKKLYRTLKFNDMKQFYLRYEAVIWLIVFLILVSPFVYSTYEIIRVSYVYYYSNEYDNFRRRAWIWWYEITPLLGMWFVCLIFWVVIYMIANFMMKLKSNSRENKIIKYETGTGLLKKESKEQEINIDSTENKPIINDDEYTKKLTEEETKDKKATEKETTVNAYEDYKKKMRDLYYEIGINKKTEKITSLKQYYLKYKTGTWFVIFLALLSLAFMLTTDGNTHFLIIILFLIYLAGISFIKL